MRPDGRRALQRRRLLDCRCGPVIPLAPSTSRLCATDRETIVHVKVWVLGPLVVLVVADLAEHLQVYSYNITSLFQLGIQFVLHLEPQAARIRYVRLRFAYSLSISIA